MKISKRLDGLAGFRTALSQIAAPTQLIKLLEQGAEDIRAAARGNLADGQPPDDRSGALAGSLTINSADDGLSFTISTPIDYGWHLEFGSAAHPAAPWLAPALDAARPKILACLRDWLAASAKGASTR